MKQIAPIAVVIAAIFACQHANASLIGTNVTVTDEFPDLPLIIQQDNVLVTGGVELPSFGADRWSVDIDADTFLVTWISSSITFDGDELFRFEDLDWGITPGFIDDVQITGGAGIIAPPTIQNVTPTSFEIFFPELTQLQQGGFVEATVFTTHVPEPSSLLVWSLLGLAIGGFTWRRRRR